MLLTLLGLSLASAAPRAPVPTRSPEASAPVIASAPRFSFLTGRQLYERCVDSSQISGSYCFAYVAGVHDLARSYETWLNVREFCLPSGTTQAELRDTFLNFARRRPADLDGQAASIVLAATKERFRCVVGR